MKQHYTRDEIIKAIMADELDGMIVCFGQTPATYGNDPMSQDYFDEKFLEAKAADDSLTKADFQRLELQGLPADVVAHWTEGWVDAITKVSQQ